MLKTPDLSGFAGSFPKPVKKVKQSKVQKWDNGRAELKAIFKEAGAISCEGKFVKDCRRTNYLSFAHKDKRRNLSDDEVIDKDCVALLCIPCHTYIERLPRLEMQKIVENIVKERGW